MSSTPVSGAVFSLGVSDPWNSTVMHGERWHAEAGSPVSTLGCRKGSSGNTAADTASLPVGGEPLVVLEESLRGGAGSLRGRLCAGSLLRDNACFCCYCFWFPHPRPLSAGPAPVEGGIKHSQTQATRSATPQGPVSEAAVPVEGGWGTAGPRCLFRALQGELGPHHRQSTCICQGSFVPIRDGTGS